MSHAVRALLGTRPAIAMGAFAVIALAAMPIAAVLLIALSSGGSGTLAHLVSTVLPESARVTVLLMAGVGLGTAATGVCAAWLISSCRFPGKRLFEIALVLPLAMPLYITAFAYIEFFDYTGPLQTLIRHIGGYTSARDYWFPDIRSLPGAIFIMSSALYPYVYLTSRIVFLMQSATALNVARTLGRSALGAFWSVALPLARPAIVAGVTLAMMECLNDIGAVELSDITVDTPDTFINDGDGLCSLVEAVANANDQVTGQPYVDCPPGDAAGPDTVVLAAGELYTLTTVYTDSSGLPAIDTEITIAGNGATIARDPAAGMKAWPVSIS